MNHFALGKQCFLLLLLCYPHVLPTFVAIVTEENLNLSWIKLFFFFQLSCSIFKCFWCSSYSLIFGILSMDFATVVYLKARIFSASPASHLQIVFSELRQQHRSVTQFWNILYVKLPLCFAQKLLLTVVAPLCFKSFFKGSTLYFYQRHEYLCRTLPVLSKRFFFPWAI